MAVVAYTSQGNTNNNASVASTTLNFVAPASFSAGEVWICSASFRGGSTTTISGVPGSFTLIKRTDSGSATTNVTIVSYWYVALGSETPSATFASITIGASSKYATVTDPFTGCNTSNPITGSTVSGTGATTASTSSALAALGTGQMAYCFGALQGASNSSPVVRDAASAGSGGVAFASTTGGSAATNVGENSARLAAATNATSQVWNLTVGSTTSALHAFILAPLQPTPPEIVVANFGALTRASSW